LNRVRHLTNWALLSVIGLVVAATGMLVQVAAGSELYPSLTGPIVLVLAAVFVVFGPGRWAAWVGLVIPLVLGLGAIVAAVMTGEFTDQLTGIGNAAILLGSWLHVIGLAAAITGGVGMLLDRRDPVTVER
jgi:hypothetical protein